VTFVRGWESIREDDRGLLWEHIVLDALRAVVDDRNLLYWRDKSGREVDFVIRSGQEQADAIECKINADSFEPAALSVFRSLYPQGRNYVISPNVKTTFQRRYGDNLQVDFTPVKQLYAPK
jgi:predicted AAA+ superfamily ATPase